MSHLGEHEDQPSLPSLQAGFEITALRRQSIFSSPHPSPVLVAAIDPTPAGLGAGNASPSLRGVERSDRALGDGRISALPLPSALGFGYRHRSLGDFCFVFLGASQLDAIRARSCSLLCRRERKITPGESTQLRGSRSCKPGFCTWGGWTEKLLFLPSSSHLFPG